MTRVRVQIDRAFPAPWSPEGSLRPVREVEASMLGRPCPMPDGGELGLVNYGEQPHWTPGQTAIVWGLVRRLTPSSPWLDWSIRAESAAFGALAAQGWRDGYAERAWTAARGRE